MSLAVLAALASFVGVPSVEHVRAQLDPAVEDRVAAATVLVVALVVTMEDGIPTGEHWRVPLGSGVLVSADGLVLTNSHVIDMSALQSDVDTEENVRGLDLEIEDEFLVYVVDGLDDDPEPRFSATVALNRQSLDLAVLEINGDEKGFPLRRAVGEDRSPVEVGEPGTVGSRDQMHILGYPVFGVETGNIGATTIDAVDGRVRSLERGPGLGNVRLIHIDATLSAGSSGGAVVDERGRLVGIVTEARGGVVGGSEAVVIPIDRALTVLREAGWDEPSPTPVSTPTSEPIPSPPSTAPPTITPLPTTTADIDVPFDIAYEVGLIQPDVVDQANPYSVSVWIAGTQEQLASIASVTYYLHPTFQPSIVTRYSPEDGFRLDFSAWGQFEIRARVTFKDGGVADLSKYLAF